MRANLASNGPELYIGTDGERLVWAGSQQALLVLGPPRSGKTSSLVVPNVLAAPGPVVVTSTKPDVLRATLASRLEVGRCWVMDPTGSVELPPGAELLRWSPVQASFSWEEALVSARVMTAAARPQGHLGHRALAYVDQRGAAQVRRPDLGLASHKLLLFSCARGCCFSCARGCFARRAGLSRGFLARRW
jgi:hypothetical protein